MLQQTLDSSCRSSVAVAVDQHCVTLTAQATAASNTNSSSSPYNCFECISISDSTDDSVSAQVDSEEEILLSDDSSSDRTSFSQFVHDYCSDLRPEAVEEKLERFHNFLYKSWNLSLTTQQSVIDLTEDEN